MREFQELDRDDNGTGRLRTCYRPEIIYSYEIAGVRYTSDKASGSTRMSSNVEAFARTMAEKYPAGMAVEVHYNPDNPAESVLQPGGRRLLLLWLVPLAVLALAYFIGR